MALLSLYSRDHSTNSVLLALVHIEDGSTPPVLSDSTGAGIPIAWQPSFSMGSLRLRFGLAQAAGLSQDQEYSFDASVGGTRLARASVRTLPARLGDLHSPLTLWFASCYSRLRTESRRARWWSSFYDKAKKAEKRTQRPTGRYLVRQWAAAARGVRDDATTQSIHPSKKGDERWSNEWGTKSKRNPLL